MPTLGAQPMLTYRASTILNLLIDEYVQTATPVASDGIARSPALRVSPATVRSAMSQLTEEGYISRPHVSAGGVPSDLGYRHYVESLDKWPELPGRLRRRVDLTLGRMEPDAGGWARRCAAVLSQMTANLAIVTEPRSTSPRLKRLHLVFLQESVALLVIVLDEMRVLKRMLTLAEPVTQNHLDQVAERLNCSLTGLNRRQIRSLILELDQSELKVLGATLEIIARVGGGRSSGASRRGTQPLAEPAGICRRRACPAPCADDRRTGYAGTHHCYSQRIRSARNHRGRKFRGITAALWGHRMPLRPPRRSGRRDLPGWSNPHELPGRNRWNPPPGSLYEPHGPVAGGRRRGLLLGTWDASKAPIVPSAYSLAWPVWCSRHATPLLVHLL